MRSSTPWVLTLIHTNLNMIFYTHVKKKYTNTHTHTDCSRNWVLILGWKYCEKKVFSSAFKDVRVEQCLRSCGSEFQMWGPKQEKVRKPWDLRLYCWISSMRVSEEERRVNIFFFLHTCTHEWNYCKICKWSQSLFLRANLTDSVSVHLLWQWVISHLAWIS